MGLSFNKLTPEFTDEYITVRSAAKFSGYNQQYLRRLLREGIFETKRVGQIWLIKHVDFDDYLSKAKISKDKRFGPQNISNK